MKAKSFRTDAYRKQIALTKRMIKQGLDPSLGAESIKQLEQMISIKEKTSAKSRK